MGNWAYNTYLVGGGFNPFEKYARQIGSFPQGSGWTLKKNWNHHLVKCWLGARWFGIRIAVPLSNNPFHKGKPNIHYHQPKPPINHLVNPELSKATPNGYISKSEKLLQMATPNGYIILQMAANPFFGIHVNPFQGLMEEIFQAPEI